MDFQQPHDAQRKRYWMWQKLKEENTITTCPNLQHAVNGLL